MADHLQEFFGKSQGGIIITVAGVVLGFIALVVGTVVGLYIYFNNPQNLQSVPYSPDSYLGDYGAKVKSQPNSSSNSVDAITAWDEFPSDQKKVVHAFEAARRNRLTGNKQP